MRVTPLRRNPAQPAVSWSGSGAAALHVDGVLHMSSEQELTDAVIDEAVSELTDSVTGNAKSDRQQAPGTPNGSGAPANHRSKVRAVNPEHASARTGFYALYRKELCDHFTGWRVVILFALMFVVTAASLNGAITNLSDALTSSGSDYAFLKIFTTSGTSIYSFTTFLAFLGPLIGITLGFDAVSNEKSQGTLIRLAAQPIYRDAIINAKFLAGATVIAVLVLTLGGFECGIGILRTGVTVSVEEAGRVLMFLLYTIMYMCLWLAVAVFFSVVCKHAATAALACIAIWLFLTLFMSLVASGLANAIYPLTGIGYYTNQMNNYAAQLALNRVSPYYLFSEAVSTILNPNVRSVGITTMSQYQGAIAGYLSFGQSLLLIWPHLVSMFAAAAAFFAASYIAFMRQEIRA